MGVILYYIYTYWKKKPGEKKGISPLKRVVEGRKRYDPKKVYGFRSQFTRLFEEPVANLLEGFVVPGTRGIAGSRPGQPTFPPLHPTSIGAKNSNLSAAMYANINRTYRVGLPGISNYLPRAQYLRIENDLEGVAANPMNFSQIMAYTKLGVNVAQGAAVTVSSTSSETGYSAASTVVSGDPLGLTKWRAAGTGANEFFEINFGSIHDIEYLIFINDSDTQRAKGAVNLEVNLLVNTPPSAIPTGASGPTGPSDPSRSITYVDAPFDSSRIQYVPYCLDGTMGRYVVIRPSLGGDGRISLRQVLVYATDGDLISDTARGLTPVMVTRLPFTFDATTNCRTASDELTKLNAEMEKLMQERSEIISRIEVQQSNFRETLDYFNAQYPLCISAIDELIADINGNTSSACNATPSIPVNDWLNGYFDDLGTKIADFFRAIGDFFTSLDTLVKARNTGPMIDVLTGRSQNNTFRMRQLMIVQSRTPKDCILDALDAIERYLENKVKPDYDTLNTKRASTGATGLTSGVTFPDGTVTSTADAINKYATPDYVTTDFYKSAMTLINLIFSGPFINRPCYSDYQTKLMNVNKKIASILPLLRSASISRIESYTLSQFELRQKNTEITAKQAAIDALVLGLRTAPTGGFTDDDTGETLINDNFTNANVWTSRTPDRNGGYWILDLGTDRDIGAVLLFNAADPTAAARMAGLRVQLYSNDGCKVGDAIVPSADTMVPISFLNSIPQRSFNSGTTTFDSFYDEYESQQISDTNETVPQEDYTPVKAGYEIGNFDAEIKEIAWDSDNKEQPQKDIVWGFVSLNASQSLNYKAYMNAMNAAGNYGEDGTGTAIKPPLYHSPTFRQDYNDQATADAAQFADAMFQNGMAELLENKLESSLNKAAPRAGSKTGAQMAARTVGASAKGALPGRVGVRGRSLIMRSMFSKAQTRLATVAASRAANVATGIGTGTLQVAVGTVELSNPATAADGVRNISIGSMLIVAITLIDILAAVLTATLAPYFDSIWEGEGVCPEGYKIWEDHLGDTFSSIVEFLPIVGSITGIFRDYYCWSNKLPAAKLKMAIRYPAWMNDRTLSLIYHDWNDGVNPNYEPRGAIRGDPGFLLPEDPRDIKPPNIANGFWADYSSPVMLEAMANFYNDKSRNNPFFVEDGRVEYKIITRIMGVIASSEFSCDVRCEMKTVRHDPITGDGYEEDFGCSYDPEVSPEFAGETDCFRRFYFTRVGSEPQGVFTVTACTNADYTAIDAMIQSYGPLPENVDDTPPLIQSVPKVFKSQWVRQKPPYNWRAGVSGTLAAVGPIALGIGAGKAVGRFGSSKAMRKREGFARGYDTLNKALGEMSKKGDIRPRQGGGYSSETFVPPSFLFNANAISKLNAKEARKREKLNTVGAFLGAIVGAGAGVGMAKLSDPTGPFMTLLGERSADPKVYYKCEPPDATRTRFTFLYKSDDWTIDMGPIVEQANGFRPNIDLCKSFITSEGYCADKRIVKQFKEEYERRNPTKHIRTLKAIEPRVSVNDLSNNGCWYQFTEVQFNPATNEEGSAEVLAESVMTNTQVDPNTCIFIPDTIVPASQYKTREITFNPGAGKPLKKYYPTRVIPESLQGQEVNKEAYPTRYPKKDFRMPRGLPSDTLGGATCPTRKCQDRVQVAELVRQFNSRHNDRKIIRVLRGWTPDSRTCEYEVEMMRILPTVEGFSSMLVSTADGTSWTRVNPPQVTVQPASGPEGPSGPTGPTQSQEQIYRDGIPIGTPPPPGSTVMARESLRMRVNASPRANCIFDLESDESNTINSGRYVTMKYRKEQYGYDISGGLINFDEDLFKLEGEPEQPEYQGDNSLFSTAKSVMTRLTSLFSTNYEKAIDTPLKKSNQILQGVVAKGLSTQGFAGCPTVTCTSPQILSAFQNEFDRTNYRILGFGTETKRISRILRAVKTGPSSCDILAEIKKESRTDLMSRAAYSDSILELYKVNFTNTGNCTFAVASSTGSIISLPSTDIKANMALQSPNAAVNPPYNCSINCRSATNLAALKGGIERQRQGLVVSAILASLNTNADTCEYVISDDKENTQVATMRFTRAMITPDTPCTFTPRETNIVLYNENEVDQILNMRTGEYDSYINGVKIALPILAAFSTETDPATINADIDITAKVF